MDNYQIIRKEYHDENGIATGPTFYVRELKSFLIYWKRWVYIKHTACSWGVSQQRELLLDFWMKMPKTHKHKGVAEHYIDNYILNNI